jgi:hypothetical protein
MSAPATFADGVKHGEELGRARALRELAALETDPEALARLSQRLFVAEQITDWLASYFDDSRKRMQEGKRPYGINGHIEHHVREQIKMREGS